MAEKDKVSDGKGGNDDKILICFIISFIPPPNH